MDVVMIQHHHRHTGLPNRFQRLPIPSATVDGYQQNRTVLEHARHMVRPEPVSVPEAVRHHRYRREPQRSKEVDEERRRRQAIHVVIAENDDSFTVSTRPRDEVDRTVDFRQFVRIRQIFQRRGKKTLSCLRVANAAPIEKCCDERMVSQ